MSKEIKRVYAVECQSKHPAYIDYLFDHKHFAFNDAYDESAKNAVEDYGYDEDMVVSKWILRDADISFEVKDHTAIVYGFMNGVETQVAVNDGLDDDDVEFLAKAKKKVSFSGGLGKKILMNDETGRYRWEREQYYPWTFYIHGVVESEE